MNCSFGSGTTYSTFTHTGPVSLYMFTENGMTAELCTEHAEWYGPELCKPAAAPGGLSTGTAWIRPPAVLNRVADADTRTTADALRDTGNHHQGTRVHGADAAHQRAMRRSGLVGPRGGLTRRGSIAAERLRNAALDDAFGAL